MKQKLTAYLKAHDITLYEFCKVNGFNWSTAKNWLDGSNLPNYKNGKKLESILENELTLKEE